MERTVQACRNSDRIMDAAAIETLPRQVFKEGGLWPRTLEELRAFAGLAVKPAKPPVDLDAVFVRIAQLTDRIYLSIIEKRTAEEFRAAITEHFNDYLHVMRAKSDLLRVVL